MVWNPRLRVYKRRSVQRGRSTEVGVYEFAEIQPVDVWVLKYKLIHQNHLIMRILTWGDSGELVVIYLRNSWGVPQVNHSTWD